MMKLNINSRVQIRLNALGKSILRDHGRYFDETLEWSDWQLHDMIDTFGPYIGMGMPMPFDTDIRIYERDLKKVGDSE